MNRYLLFIFFSCIYLQVWSQFIDSIPDLLRSRPGIDARLETRNSFIENNRAKISGVRLGLNFKKKLRIGFGYSWLSSDLTEKKTIIDAYKNSQVVDNYLKFGYFAYYVDFVFHKTKRWQLSVPLQLGTGLSWFEYRDGIFLIKSKKYFLFLYEPGISVQFKLFHWLGFGTDIAYRFTLKNSHYVGEKLNSPTYAFKLLIWFDQLYFLTFPKSKLTQQFGPADW